MMAQVINATLYEVEVSYWFQNTNCSGAPSETLSNQSSVNCVGLENEVWVQILPDGSSLAGQICEDSTCSTCEGAIESGVCFQGTDSNDGALISAQLTLKEVSSSPTPTPTSSVPKQTPTPSPKVPTTTSTPTTKQGSGNYDKVEINQQANVNIS
ncbi:hypothetical protein Gasu2_49270 [Galdieria sulphuraria]|nr:hypothetical protein Gasu2_49270 [Galdieria sulphuraria]